MKRIASLVLVLTLALSGQALGADVSKGIKIGSTGPYTGAAAAPGMEIHNSIQLAVDQVNAAGGIAGQQVEVVMGDTAGDPAQGVNVAQKFCADDQIYGVVGPAMSDIAAATMRTYSGCGLVQISSAASAEDLTEKGYDHFFRTTVRNDAHGPAIATFMVEELDPESVYILNAKDAYSQGMADQVAAKLAELGVDQVWQDTVVSGEKDFSAVMTKVKAKNPSILFFASKPPPDHTVMVRNMREQGVEATYFGTEGAKDEKEFIEASEGAAEGAYIQHFAPDLDEIPAAADYVEAFEAKHGSLSGFGPTAYEATMILLDSIAKAAEDGEISRGEVKKNVAATEGHEGILGFPVTFDAKGDIKGGATYIYIVEDGEFKLLDVAASK
jgi:branched-chain amino acid transport system substrate-binding protein